jgi:CheY-like chemotaxis protein
MKRQSTILLVDDDDIFIFLTRKMLASTGMAQRVIVYKDAADAITFLQDNNDDIDALPDVILLDLNMPGMNGWQFLQAYEHTLHNLKKIPRLYVVSSSIANEDAEKAKACIGVMGYISKPFSLETLKHVLSL